jgi:putative PEP-CTERM system TPR-repeat lipoprotein
VAQFRRGQREQAIDTLESLVELAPDRAIRSALILGFFYYSQNQLAEARAIADRVVKQQPNNLVALNLQGAVAISQGERREGRRMLEAVLVKDPAFRPARFNLVKLDILEGNADAARRELDALLAADPNDVRTLLEYARFARSQGDQRAAIQQLEKIRQVDPKALLPILELVELYLADGRLTDALTTALALDQNVPENFSVHEALARVRLAQGEKAYARNVLQKAARLAGYDAQLLLRTARLQVATGALEDATWTLSQLLKEQPDRLEARNLLAAVLFRQGRLVEAEAEVQKIRTVTPNDILSLALLGDIRTAQGQLADALATYRKAQQIADTPQLMISVHRTLMRLGRADQALTELQAWHDAHPKVPQIMSLLASHRRLIGETEAAWKLLEELVQLTPDDPMALNALADILIAIDNEKALRVAMRAYELAPQHPAVLDTLGWTLVQLGELDRGLGHLREARARSGHDPTIGYHLAVALQEYGNAEEAKRELRQALGLGIPFPEQEEARRRLEGLDALRN